MRSARLEAFLAQLASEFRKRGVDDTRLVEEAREHLVDIIDEGIRHGLSAEAAEHQAFTRFGHPELVAAGFAEGRYRMLNWLPNMLSRVAGVLRRQGPHSGHYHDVSGPSVVHFALRLKRPLRARFAKMSPEEQNQFVAERQKRGEDVTAFETDPQERLVQFLREFGRRKFGSGETLESITLLEDMTDSTKRGGRYLAAFGSGTKMIWTVTLRSDGAVSFDGTTSPA
jgi:hypothetical protein